MGDQLEKDRMWGQIRALNWVHQIDLGNGLVTPGRWPPHPLIVRAMDAIDFKGKTVLDIGCWDGLWSFEAERRGASGVFATDCLSQRSYKEQPTFNLAREILRSNVQYYPDVSVYDVARRLTEQTFDIILFLGVYYHLKDPLLAMARLRRMLRPGGLLVVEGEVIADHQASFARFYYKNRHGDDPSNWWIPTIPCLREWIQCNYYDIVGEYDSSYGHAGSAKASIKSWLKGLLGRQVDRIARHVIVAKAVIRNDKKYCFPDSELREFDLTQSS